MPDTGLPAGCPRGNKGDLSWPSLSSGLNAEGIHVFACREILERVSRVERLLLALVVMGGGLRWQS